MSRGRAPVNILVFIYESDVLFIMLILIYMSICYLRSPQAARAVSAVMNHGALPAHVRSPSKENQTISKTNLKRKRTSGKSGSSVSVRPAPPSIPKVENEYFPGLEASLFDVPGYVVKIMSKTKRTEMYTTI